MSNAYLYGDLDETVFMEQPTDSSGAERASGKVCKVLKSIYGIAEAGKIWGNVLHRTVISWGFPQSGVDNRLDILINSQGLVILTVVVDDMVFASDSRTS